MRPFQTVFLVLCLFATMSMAGDLQPMSTTEGGESITADRDAVFCQQPDFWGMLASQIDLVYPFEAGAIDDFTPDYDVPISAIQWWGVYWNANPDLGPVEYFVISVFEDDGQCYPVEEPFYQEEIHLFTEVGVDENTFEYNAEIPIAQLNAGQAYWLEIQAVMLYDPAGQWGWATSDMVNWCAPLQGFPALEIPFWSETESASLAFCLYSEVTGVEAQSWSQVKSLFR